MDFCKHLKWKKMYTSFKQSVLILFLFFKIPQAGQTLIFYCYKYIDIEWRQRLAVQNELRRTLCIGMGSSPIISFFLTVLIRCFFFLLYNVCYKWNNANKRVSHIFIKSWIWAFNFKLPGCFIRSFVLFYNSFSWFYFFIISILLPSLDKPRKKQHKFCKFVIDRWLQSLYN